MVKKHEVDSKLQGMKIDCLPCNKNKITVKRMWLMTERRDTGAI